MDDLLIKVIVEILNDFTPISLVAVILGNLFTELIKGWRGRQQQSRPVRETLAFLAVMAMMTGWAFLAVAIPLGMAGVARLAAAPAWLLTASLLLYLLIAFPLGYVMLGLLLNAQESTPLDRHELARRNTPFYVYGALVKLGVVLATAALFIFPSLSVALAGLDANAAALLRFALTAFLLVDTISYGWILIKT
ncbi:MAG: hypothetical protein WBD79_06920 [Anaerolineae bacterium]